MLTKCIPEYPRVEDTVYSIPTDSQFLYRMASTVPNESEVSVPVLPLIVVPYEGIPQTFLNCNCILSLGYPRVKDN